MKRKKTISNAKNDSQTKEKLTKQKSISSERQFQELLSSNPQTIDFESVKDFPDPEALLILFERIENVEKINGNFSHFDFLGRKFNYPSVFTLRFMNYYILDHQPYFNFPLFQIWSWDFYFLGFLSWTEELDLVKRIRERKLPDNFDPPFLSDPDSAYFPSHSPVLFMLLTSFHIPWNYLLYESLPQNESYMHQLLQMLRDRTSSPQDLNQCKINAEKAIHFELETSLNLRELWETWLSDFKKKFSSLDEMFAHFVHTFPPNSWKDSWSKSRNITFQGPDRLLHLKASLEEITMEGRNYRFFRKYESSPSTFRWLFDMNKPNMNRHQFMLIGFIAFSNGEFQFHQRGISCDACWLIYRRLDHPVVVNQKLWQKIKQASELPFPKPKFNFAFNYKSEPPTYLHCTCGVVFDDPKIAPCGHTLCSNCQTKLNCCNNNFEKSQLILNISLQQAIDVLQIDCLCGLSPKNMTYKELRSHYEEKHVIKIAQLSDNTSNVEKRIFPLLNNRKHWFPCIGPGILASEYYDRAALINVISPSSGKKLFTRSFLHLKDKEIQSFDLFTFTNRDNGLKIEYLDENLLFPPSNQSWEDGNIHWHQVSKARPLHSLKSITIVGPNGCGKSTLLQKIKGNGTWSIDARRYMFNPAEEEEEEGEGVKTNAFEDAVKEVLKQENERAFDTLPVDKQLLTLLNDVFSVFGIKFLVDLSKHSKYEDSLAEYDKSLYFVQKNRKQQPVILLSDGQKDIFALCYAFSKTDDQAIFLVDEPEAHLHRDAVEIVWNIFERTRTNALFIYATHDLSFVASRMNSQVISVSDCNYDTQTLTWQIEDNLENIHMQTILRVAGKKGSRVLFVEGDNQTSIDVRLYRLVYDQMTIVPRGGCSDVVKAVDSFKTLTFNPLLGYRADAFGIIDRDFKTEDELNQYENVLPLRGIVEIELFFCIPEVCEALDRCLQTNNAKKVEKSLWSYFNQLSFVETQIANYKKYLQNQKEINNVQKKLRERQELLESAIANQNLDQVFLLFNLPKSNVEGQFMAATEKYTFIGEYVGKHYGMKSEEFVSTVLHFLSTKQTKDFFEEAISKYLPPTTAFISYSHLHEHKKLTCKIQIAKSILKQCRKEEQIICVECNQHTEFTLTLDKTQTNSISCEKMRSNFIEWYKISMTKDLLKNLSIRNSDNFEKWLEFCNDINVEGLKNCHQNWNDFKTLVSNLPGGEVRLEELFNHFCATAKKKGNEFLALSCQQQQQSTEKKEQDAESKLQSDEGFQFLSVDLKSASLQAIRDCLQKETIGNWENFVVQILQNIEDHYKDMSKIKELLLQPAVRKKALCAVDRLQDHIYFMIQKVKEQIDKIITEKDAKFLGLIGSDELIYRFNENVSTDKLVQQLQHLEIKGQNKTLEIKVQVFKIENNVWNFGKGKLIYHGVTKSAHFLKFLKDQKVITKNFPQWLEDLIVQEQQTSKQRKPKEPKDVKSPDNSTEHGISETEKQKREERQQKKKEQENGKDELIIGVFNGEEE